MKLFNKPRWHWLCLAGPSVLLGCKLTSNDVEPSLPAVPVNNSATLVYRANNQPVVANNSTDFAKLIVSFLGDLRAVRAKWPTGGNLELFGSDIDNQPDGYLTHSLVLELVSFHGIGTYSLLPTSPTSYPASYYQLTTYSSTGSPVDHAEQYPVISAPAQVVITDWNPSTRHINGTFALDVAGVNNLQNPTHLTEGSFDLVVD
ncbi:hypothetical protein [Hymenobacter sp. BRD67]|uniref:hypothetical protein n=1 Tax=Hymenobacter sp. BRD67 TaxID=2675877 RepID=UPI001564E300|nr:hypothetical protein [Hymenobacter sp. BRD67]QKG51649.1 hypothetical protein GKZ67_02355 [Hymenobacter sp. BRD67]